jgi:hypothetical protein
VSINPTRIPSEEVVRGPLENNREHTGIFSQSGTVQYQTDQDGSPSPYRISYYKY